MGIGILYSKSDTVDVALEVRYQAFMPQTTEGVIEAYNSFIIIVV